MTALAALWSAGRVAGIATSASPSLLRAIQRARAAFDGGAPWGTVVAAFADGSPVSLDQDVQTEVVRRGEHLLGFVSARADLADPRVRRALHEALGTVLQLGYETAVLRTRLALRGGGA